MKKSSDLENTNILRQSRSLETQLSTRKKQRETLEKQIDNLMIQNNMLRSQSKSGKLQLILLEKEKEIRNLKQKYQSQSNILNTKLENYVKIVQNNNPSGKTENITNNLVENKKSNESKECHQCKKTKNQLQALKNKYLQQKSQRQNASKQNMKNLYNFPPDLGQTMIQINKQLQTLKQIIQNKEAIIHSLNQLLFEIKQFNQQLKSELQTLKTKYILETSNYKETIEKLNVRVQQTQNLKQVIQKQLQKLKSAKNDDIMTPPKKVIQEEEVIQKKLNARLVQLQKQFQEKYRNQLLRLRNEIQSLIELNNIKTFNQNQTILLKQKLDKLITSYNELKFENDKMQSIVKQSLNQRQKYQAINAVNNNLLRRIENLEIQKTNLQNQLSNLFNSKRSASTTNFHQEQYNFQIKSTLEKLQLQNQRLASLNLQLENQVLVYKTNESQKLYRTRADYYGVIETPKKQNKRMNYILNSPKDKVEWINLQEKIHALKSQNKQIRKLLNYKIY